MLAMHAVHTNLGRCGRVRGAAARDCKCACTLLGRRGILGLLTTGTLVLLPEQPAEARIDPQLVELYRQAMVTPENTESLWSRAIDLDPGNSASWSNRGTSRLQRGDWRGAAADLEHAAALETASKGRADAVVLNNLGNAQGALGDWDGAAASYKAASQDPEMEAIALANLSLARFQQGRDQEAVRVARQLLRRDGDFLDARCALVAFLWGLGDEAGAEGEWSALQSSQDGLGGFLYSKAAAVDRVRGRWPPRATAALRAFLSVQRTGKAVDYDGREVEYTFATG